jgi:hypothetical protein
LQTTPISDSPVRDQLGQSEGVPPRCDPGSALPSSKYRVDDWGCYLQRKAEVKKDRAMPSGIARDYDTSQDRLSGFFLGFDLDDEINVVSGSDAPKGV